MASQEGVSLLSLLWVAPQEDHIAVYLVVLSGWYQGCALGNRGPQTILCQKPISYFSLRTPLCPLLMPVPHLSPLSMRWSIVIVYFPISVAC